MESDSQRYRREQIKRRRKGRQKKEIQEEINEESVRTEMRGRKQKEGKDQK